MEPKPITLSRPLGLDTRNDIGKVPPGKLIDAHNVRYLDDSIVMRPGLSLALRVPLSPCTDSLSITTECPLPEGTSGDPYGPFQLEVTGGTGPYTWSLAGGTIDAGVTLSPDGILYGTIESVISTVFTLILKVVAADGCVVFKSCVLPVNGAICCPLPRTIAALIPGDETSWAHNSRIGPFMAAPDETCEFSNRWCFIIRDKDNLKRLMAYVSDDQGVTFTETDAIGFESLERDIVSFDCEPNKLNADFIEVLTQEVNTGRTAYHRFNLETKLWSINNVEVNPATAVSRTAAFAPSANNAKITFSPITLGATTTYVGWYYLTNAVNNYNPIAGSNGSNEIYYGSGDSAGKVGIVKSGSTIFQSTAVVVANAWHFLVIRDTGAALQAKYDDVDMGNSVGPYTSLSGMSISRTNQGQNGNNFKGRMQCVAIFNRSLSDAECTALYNAGAGLYVDSLVAPYDTGLTIGLPLNEGVGFFTKDVSSNNNDGTLVVQQWGVGHITGDVEISDALGFVNGTVSITSNRTTGRPIAGYDSTAELVSGDYWARFLVREQLVDTSWDASAAWGRIGEADQSILGRLVSGLSNRIHAWSKSHDNFAIKFFDVQTLKSDATLSGVTHWGGSGLSGADLYYIGTQDTYLDTGVVKIVLPLRIGGQFYVSNWTDANVMVAPDLTTTDGSLIWYGSGSSQKPSAALKYTDSLHTVAFRFSIGGDTWIIYDAGQLKYGPEMPLGTPREFDGNIIRAYSDNWIATLLATSAGIKFQLIAESELPSPDIQFADWITDVLGTQDPAIEEECS